MRFSEKLSKQRKNNNLSQEQLAEKLNVSRQAVSKWESGLSYPDMDKMIKICKILNCNLDDLMDDGVIEGKKENMKVNDYFNDFLSFITKTYNMFWSMKLKQKIKCILELFILAVILFCVGAMIYVIVDSLILNYINQLPILGFHVNRGLTVLILLGLIVMGLIIFIHLFKIRYLDYFITVEDENVNEKTVEKALPEERIIDHKKYIVEPHKEKVIIRDPKHSKFNFFQLCFTMILWIVKIFVSFFALFMAFVLLGILIIGFIDLYFLQYGSLFFYILLAIIGSFMISFLFFYMSYNFIFSHKSKPHLLLIIFMIGLVFMGSGMGLSIVRLMNYDYVDLDKDDLRITKEEVDMQENLRIHGDVQYVIDNERENLLFEVNDLHFQEHTFKCSDYDEYKICYDSVHGPNFTDVYHEVMKNLKNNKIKNYDSYDRTIKIYLSEENYQKIKQNNQNM